MCFSGSRNEAEKRSDFPKALWVVTVGLLTQAALQTPFGREYIRTRPLKLLGSEVNTDLFVWFCGEGDPAVSCPLVTLCCSRVFGHRGRDSRTTAVELTALPAQSPCRLRRLEGTAS